MLFYYYLKKYWSEALVLIFTLGMLWLLIFYWYPYYLHRLLIFHSPTTDLSEEAGSFGRGTFGDMYGALNTFLSGLAFLGAVIAILLQVFQLNSDKRKFEDEMKVQLNLFKWHIQRLTTIYLPNLKHQLENKREKLNLRLLKINFQDDYSFRELEKINILELYKGFILLDKKTEANELISFFQQFKEVHDDYKSIEEFIRENETELQDLKWKMNIQKGNLNQILKLRNRLDLINEVNSSGLNYPYIGISENEDIDPLLKKLDEYSNYIKAIKAFSEAESIFKIYKEDKITRINNILTLCNTLSNAIPSI